MERKTNSNSAVMDVIRLIFVNYNQISCDSFEVLIQEISVFTHRAVYMQISHMSIYIRETRTCGAEIHRK